MNPVAELHTLKPDLKKGTLTANELAKISEWTFFQEVQPTKDVMVILLQGEQAYAAFKTINGLLTTFILGAR